MNHVACHPDLKTFLGIYLKMPNKFALKLNTSELTITTASPINYGQQPCQGFIYEIVYETQNRRTQGFFHEYRYLCVYPYKKVKKTW